MAGSVVTETLGWMGRTEAERYALQLHSDVLVLIGLLRDSGHPVASTPVVAEIAARHHIFEDTTRPTLDEVIDDAIQNHAWDTMHRLIPEITAMPPAAVLAIADRCRASMGSRFARFASRLCDALERRGEAVHA